MINIFNPVISKVEGGGKFNIHYGLNPPEDTSMLWVQTEREPSKTTITADFVVDKVLEQLTTTFPFTLGSGHATVVGKKVYFTGCNNGSTYVKNIIKYDTESGIFETLPFTVPEQAVPCAVGSKIYIFGGRIVTTWYTDIYCFDTDNDTLEKLDTVLDEGGSAYHTVNIGTKIYLLGGTGSNGTSSSSKNTIRVFDTADNSLTKLTAVLPSALYGGACILHDTTIYIFGGNYNENTPRSSIYVFDTVEEKTSTLGVSLPTASAYKGCGKIGNKVYLFGGYSKTLSTNTNDILEYDFDKGTIVKLTLTMPTVRSKQVSATVGGSIYLFGGVSYISTTKYLNEILRLELASDLENGECVIIPSLDGSPIELMKGTNVLSIGVSQAVIGNANNEGEFVKIYAHNGTTWEEI